MVDEEQDFNEEDEGNLSLALDEAREGNQQISELISFLQDNVKGFLSEIPQGAVDPKGKF